MLISATVGVCVLWPMVRLSQRRPERTAAEVAAQQQSHPHVPASGPAAVVAAVSSSRPLSRCRARVPNSAARGSWVTMTTVVPRSRFLPVKKTSDLLLIRSDCYRLADDFTLAESRPAQLGRLLAVDPPSGSPGGGEHEQRGDDGMCRVHGIS